MVSIQSSYTSPSKCKCSSPSRNLVSCPPLTFYFCSLSYLSCGDVICGTSEVCLTTCITIGTINHSTLPLTIFCALTFVVSCPLFTHEPEAPPSNLFFFLKALLGESVIAFFLFSSVVYISSLVLLTLVGGFVDSPFDAQTNIKRFLPIPRKTNMYFSYLPYFP